MNILEKRKPVTPIKEEEKGPEDVPSRNNYILKSPKPAAVRSTAKPPCTTLISGKQLQITTAKCQRSAYKFVITVRVSIDTLDCTHITTGGPRRGMLLTPSRHLYSANTIASSNFQLCSNSKSAAKIVSQFPFIFKIHGSRDEESFDNVDNLDMDSNNTYFESAANITARANLTVEVSVQNSDVAANDNNNATLSNITTSQLQDLLATVMAAVQNESTR